MQGEDDKYCAMFARIYEHWERRFDNLSAQSLYRLIVVDVFSSDSLLTFASHNILRGMFTHISGLRLVEVEQGTVTIEIVRWSKVISVTKVIRYNEHGARVGAECKLLLVDGRNFVAASRLDSDNDAFFASAQKMLVPERQ